MRKSSSKKPPSEPRVERRYCSALEKCQAVLAIWAERRKPSEVCRELGVKWNQLNQWQDRAMEGMLTALEPRSRKEEEKGPALGPKLQKLLEKKAGQRAGRLSKLEARLVRIQEQKQQPVTQ